MGCGRLLSLVDSLSMASHIVEPHTLFQGISFPLRSFAMIPCSSYIVPHALQGYYFFEVLFP